MRRVFVHSDDPDAADAAAQIARDTCLITVPDASHADAVLDLGIALPNVDGGGPAGPNIFGNSPHAQTMGDKSKSGFHASASATCDDSKGGGCSNSYSAPAGDLSGMSAPGGPGNSGAKLDVSLASTGTQAQELWEPNPKSKRSWSDQLRVAAGCPVCPGSHFNRRRFPSYRAWIQAECPGVLPSVR